MNNTRITQHLAGKRIVITRAVDQAGEFADALIGYGAVPILFPTIQTVPIPNNKALDSALRDLSAFDWVVFTSANGVQVAVDRLQALAIAPDLLNHCQIAAVGPATAATLNQAGLHVDLVPSADQSADTLADRLRAHIEGQRVLLLQAEIARPVLYDTLNAYGAQVTSIPVYQTVPGQPDAAAYKALRAGVNVLTFTSGSTVRNFLALLGEEGRTIAANTCVACIGRITAVAAGELDFGVNVIAAEPTTAGLIDAIARYFDELYESTVPSSRAF